MADLKIGTDSDLLFENGDLVLVQGQEAIAQHAQMRLATWLSESVYDRNEGTPFLEVIFQPSTTVNAVQLVLEQRLLGTPGITGVSLNLALNRETREMTVTGYGTTVRGNINFEIALSSSNSVVTVTTAA